MGESSRRACGLCDKTGTKLFKCGACLSVRYCGSVCQTEDWESHEKDCSVKVYPVDEFQAPPNGHQWSIGVLRNDLTGAVTMKSETRKKFIGKEMDMIVKVQTLSFEQNLDKKPEVLSVYNESRKYYVYVRGPDENKDLIIDKILKEGWSSRVDAPNLKKLYFKAHLNCDSSLDVFLNCTHNIQHW